MSTSYHHVNVRVPDIFCNWECTSISGEYQNFNLKTCSTKNATQRSSFSSLYRVAAASLFAVFASKTIFTERDLGPSHSVNAYKITMYTFTEILSGKFDDVFTISAEMVTSFCKVSASLTAAQVRGYVASLEATLMLSRTSLVEDSTEVSASVGSTSDLVVAYVSSTAYFTAGTASFRRRLCRLLQQCRINSTLQFLAQYPRTKTGQFNSMTSPSSLQRDAHEHKQL